MLSDAVRQAIEAIREDREHGASALRRKAVELLLALAREDDLAGDVSEAAALLAAAQPDMPSIAALARKAAGCRTPEELEQLAGAELTRLDRAMEAVVRHAAALIGDRVTVLTHSHSETVEQALVAARRSGRSFRVLVTESLPLGEGRELAQALTRAEVDATVVADAAVYRAMPEVDLVFTGADAVTPAGVVNKVGTALIALAARAHRRRMYAVCTSDKLTAAAREPGELYDLTPLDLFTGIVTEEGKIAPAALRGRFERDAAEEPRFVLDTHLGRLAAYLRMLGFDTLYSKTAADRELARISKAESRTLLTRDLGLLERNDATHGYYVLVTEPRAQLDEVARRYGLLERAAPFTRCLRCNTVLQPASRDDVSDSVPHAVLLRHDEFMRCPACRKVYWRGTHYVSMSRRIDRLRCQ
jgi:translation initiation factor 2B subunit (eIF-2B alpha/beta/delta family)/uncharacterized protein with PIN domain